MPVSSTISCVRQRWVLCAFCCCAFAIVSLKTSFIMEIFCIVQSHSQYGRKSTTGCPFLFEDTSWEVGILPFDLPPFFWIPRSEVLKDSTYVTGLLLMLLPAGILSDLGYSKYVIGGGMLLMVVNGLVLLLATEILFDQFLLAINFINGVSEALIYPSIFSLISRHTPPPQRNTIVAFVMAGKYYGNALGYVFNKFIVDKYGTLSSGNIALMTAALVWVVLWYAFTYCVKFESRFFAQNINTNISTSRQRRKSFLLIMLRRLLRIPWYRIFSSLPFLSLVLVHCSVDWTIFKNVWLILIPYQDYILHLPEDFTRYFFIIVISSLPTTFMGGFFANWAIKRRITSNTVIKRTFVLISVICSSVLQLLLPLTGCNVVLYWVLAVTAMYFVGLAVPVIYSSPLDLYPRHAGLLVGIMYFASTICFHIDLRFSAVLVADRYDQNEWRNNFFVHHILAVVMMIPFCFYGSGEIQHWKRKIYRHTTHTSIVDQRND